MIEKIDPSFFFGLAGLSNGFPDGGPANLAPRTILALEEGDLDYVRSAFGAPDAPVADAAAPAPVAPPAAAQPTFQPDQPLFQAPFSTLVGFAQILAASGDSGIDTHWLAIAARVPFLNGGLFDCLDDKVGKQNDNSILDGFSDNPKLTCHLPNDLFFGAERTVDLSRDYGEEGKRTARSKKAR